MKNKYFWLICSVSLFLVVLASYGFILNLFFWRDDYALLYQLKQGGLFDWPYQAITLIYYPFYIFFKANPVYYFLISFLLYFAFCFLLVKFVLYFTKDKFTSYLSGLILATGYIGLEIMYMVGTSMSGLIYILPSIFIIFLYEETLRTNKKAKHILPFSLYLVLLFLFPHRAHSLFAIIFLTDLFFSKIKTPILSIKRFKTTFLRTSPYLITTAIAFISLPRFFTPQASSSSSLQVITSFIKNFNLNYIKFFFADFTSFFIPDRFHLSLTQSAIFGFFSLIVGLILIKLPSDKKTKNFLQFSFLVWIASFVSYYIATPDIVFYSTQRYLLFSYPFLIPIIAYFLKYLIFEKKNLSLKIIGSLLLILLIFFHLRETFLYKKDIVKRAEATTNFFSDLQKEVPEIHRKTIFYFDTVSDPATEDIFGDILRVGFYPTEASLASYYGVKMSDIKIADNYDDYIKEKNNLSDSYMFFYDISKKLIKITPTKTKPQKLQLNFAKKPISQKSNILITQDKSTSSNNLINLKMDNFPLFGRLSINLNLTAQDLISEIKKFPYKDESSSVPDNLPIKMIHEKNYLNTLLSYIQDREKFRNLVHLSSSKYVEGKDPKNAIDGNLDTEWEADKRDWLDTQTASLEFQFDNLFLLSQIRFITSHPSRLPIEYEYYYFNEKADRWELFYKSKKMNYLNNVYIIDSFTPIRSKKFKMVITKTLTGDFPGISEIELLPNSNNVDSRLANFIINNPMADIQSKDEANIILSSIKENIKLYIYPISDKYLVKNEAGRIEVPIFLDGKPHNYHISLPQGGTVLKALILQLPNIPIKVSVNSINIQTE
ncbi:MAG: hypothetical protein HY044_03015 [Candidatus Woesebacteria bacterium]|nr:MAG: hypothetical protein HY044_03015 [Candidatus Woesebacteria bacterium]